MQVHRCCLLYTGIRRERSVVLVVHGQGLLEHMIQFVGLLLQLLLLLLLLLEDQLPQDSVRIRFACRELNDVLLRKNGRWISFQCSVVEQSFVDDCNRDFGLLSILCRFYFCVIQMVCMMLLRGQGTIRREQGPRGQQLVLVGRGGRGSHRSCGRRGMGLLVQVFLQGQTGLFFLLLLGGEHPVIRVVLMVVQCRGCVLREVMDRDCFENSRRDTMRSVLLSGSC